LLIAVALATILLTACAPQAVAPTTPPTRAPIAQITASADTVLVAYRKSGGIAGVDEVLTVYSSGHLELKSRIGALKQGQVAPASLEPLQKLLASSDFANLQATYAATGADLFVYEVTVLSGSAQRTVSTMDGAKRPPILDQTIAELEKLKTPVKQP